jgi:hypothetical protein
MHATFVQEFQPVELPLQDRVHNFRKGFPLTFDPRGIALAVVEALFFSGSLSRANSRDIMLGLATTPVSAATWAHSSASVRSGFRRTAVRMQRSHLAKARRLPPAQGSAVVRPVSRRRRIQLSTVVVLTWKGLGHLAERLSAGFDRLDDPFA